MCRQEEHLFARFLRASVGDKSSHPAEAMSKLAEFLDLDADVVSKEMKAAAFGELSCMTVFIGVISLWYYAKMRAEGVAASLAYCPLSTYVVV